MSSTYDFIHLFKAELHSNFVLRHGPDYAVALFEKVNDPLKMHEFLRKKNEIRFANFLADYMDPTQSTYQKDILIHEVIGDIARSFFKSEMLDWNMDEKTMFLLFVSLCKDFSKASKEDAKQKDNKRKRESDDDNEDAENGPNNNLKHSTAKCA